MSKAEEVVRQDLAAMERRDLAVARALLRPGFRTAGSPYFGIRFIDHFTVRDGQLADQNVCNDMAEILGR